MEKDIGKIARNPDTDIIIRIDDFGGKTGLTIREFVNKSETGFTGFTKSGTRISSENFEEFKRLINSINPEDLKGEPTPSQKELPEPTKDSEEKQSTSGVDESGLM
ncbi:MAG: hypothetical protein ABIF88_01485 [archaeon]